MMRLIDTALKDISQKERNAEASNEISRLIYVGIITPELVGLDFAESQYVVEPREDGYVDLFVEENANNFDAALNFWKSALEDEDAQFESAQHLLKSVQRLPADGKDFSEYDPVVHYAEFSMMPAMLKQMAIYHQMADAAVLLAVEESELENFAESRFRSLVDASVNLEKKLFVTEEEMANIVGEDSVFLTKANMRVREDVKRLPPCFSGMQFKVRDWLVKDALPSAQRLWFKLNVELDGAPMITYDPSVSNKGQLSGHDDDHHIGD